MNEEIELRLKIEQGDPDDTSPRTEVVLETDYGEILLVQLHNSGEGAKTMALLEAQKQLERLARRALALTQPPPEE